MFKVNNKNSKTTSFVLDALHKICQNKVFIDPYLPVERQNLRFCDSVPIRENTGQRKPVLWHISRSGLLYLEESEIRK